LINFTLFNIKLSALETWIAPPRPNFPFLNTGLSVN
jgi:hypothetical protein